MYVFWVPSRKYLSNWINRTGSSFSSILSHHILSLESFRIYYNSNQSFLYSLALVVWFLSTREMSSIKYWSNSVMTFLLSPYINLMLSCLKLAVVGYSFAAHLLALLDNQLKKGSWFISSHFKSLWWFPPISPNFEGYACCYEVFNMTTSSELLFFPFFLNENLLVTRRNSL